MGREVNPAELAERLCAVDGVVAVALGGSRARGTHRPDSDWDLGLYYRGELDVAGLRAVAATVADQETELTPPGGWGPWVDGGGWLRVGGTAVDWIYRDLDRVRRIWADCRAGRYEVGVQAGHPLGFYSHAYAGEVALCHVLADPTGELTALREETSAYPPALGAALVAGGWEAGFLVEAAAKGAASGTPPTSRAASSARSGCSSTPCTGGPGGGWSTRRAWSSRRGGCPVRRPASRPGRRPCSPPWGVRRTTWPPRSTPPAGSAPRCSAEWRITRMRRRAWA